MSPRTRHSQQDAAPAPQHGADFGPISGWRMLLYRTCYLIMVILVGRSYFPGRVEGAEHIPASGGAILVPIHRSYVDWLVVSRVTRRRLRPIVKAEVWKWKRLGAFIEILGAFPVHRGTADREALARAVTVLEGGEVLMLFPEGTRQRGPYVQPLLEGAAYLALRANVPLLPVGLGGTERHMPRGSAVPRPGRVHIVVGPPLLPSDFARPPKPAAEGAEGPAARKPRVGRGATREMTTELKVQIQDCFDRAQRYLGLPIGDDALEPEAAAGAQEPEAATAQEPEVAAAEEPEAAAGAPAD